MRLVVQALLGGVGIALLVPILGGFTIVAALPGSLGACLLGAMLLQPHLPARELARWLLGMVTACLLAWIYHLRLPPVAVGATWLAFGLACGLGLLCAILAWGRWARIVLRQLATPRGGLLLALGLYAGARWFAGSDHPGDIARGLLPLITMPLGLAALVCAARALPAGWLAALEQWLLDLPRWAAPAVATLAAALLSHRVIGPLPHVEDGLAYLFEAKSLLAGGLSIPLPPVPGAFEARFCWVMQSGGRMFGIFPPGWPLLLAIGASVDLGWLVNPLLAGAVVWLVGDSTSDRRLGTWAAWLLAGSPFFLLQAASYLSHTATLFWIVLGLCALRRVDRPVDAALVGLAVGMCFATRYAEGLLLGLVALGAAVQRRPPARCWLVAAAAMLPGIVLVVADNVAKTGSPELTPVEHFYTVEYGAPVNRPGFGADRGLVWDHSLGAGHSLLEGLWNSNANAWELNRLGFGWACGSLALALVGLLWARRAALDRRWLVYGGGIILIYTAYWYHGIAFGPRFWHPLIVPLCLATVAGARVLLDWLGGRREVHRRRLGALFVCATAAAWLGFVPYELGTAYRNHRGRDASDRAVLAAARELAGGRPAVVILDQRVVAPGQIAPDYGIGFALNPPGLAGEVLVARSIDAEGTPQREAIAAAWPDRVLLTWYKESDGSWRLEPLPPESR